MIALDGHDLAIDDDVNAIFAKFLPESSAPAWIEVCIAEHERARIQAIARDTEGRLQYRYHEDWEKSRSHSKERRLLRLGASLGRVRSAVKAALRSPDLTRTKVIAAVVRLIDRALLRPGCEEYARNGGGRGAATLLKSDVQVDGDTVLLDFHGKSGKEIKREVKDSVLARTLRQLAKLDGRRLLGPIAAAFFGRRARWSRLNP